MKTGQVTKAMEAVSAVKMRKSQERALEGRPFATAALEILSRVSASVEGARHSLSDRRAVSKIMILVITSDKGLAGSLNSAVLKCADEYIRESKLNKDNISVIAVGKKAKDYFMKRNYTVLKEYTNVSDSVSVEDMKDISDIAVSGFIEGMFDECAAVYTNFISTFEQEAVARALLPLIPERIREIIEEITPRRGKFADEKGEEKHIPVYTIEPGPEEVFTELLPLLINIEVYHTLLEAKASEHSARMVAMRNATDKTQDLTKELNLEFNKGRQAVITREMNEITSGIETTT